MWHIAIYCACANLCNALVNNNISGSLAWQLRTDQANLGSITYSKNECTKILEYIVPHEVHNYVQAT